ncbi:MAG: hypothetical protein WD897_02305, partial [Parcubacteria group bacterium]
LIENQLKKLPEALQQAIKIVPWQSVVKEIALLHKLDLAQIVAVERETTLVIHGFEDEKNYLPNIRREASLDEAAATAITAALNERVFKVIANKARESKPAPENIIANVPEIPLEMHPMIEKGEMAHDIPHVEQTTDNRQPPVEKREPNSPEPPKKEAVKLPDYRYPDGKDPYREPLV